MARGRTLGALAAVAVLAFPAGAAAHAELVTTYPLDEDVLQQAPPRVSVRFDEAIETGLSHVHVLAPDGRVVDTGPTRTLAGDEVGVPIPRRLAPGTYTVSWRIVADDAHAQRGGYVFHVGRPSADPAGRLAQVLAPPGRSGLATLAQALRATTFLLLLLSVGGTVGLLAIVRDRALPRLTAVLAGAAALLALSAAARVVVETAAGGGLSLREATTRRILSIVLASRFGRFSLVEVAAALALALLAAAAARSGRTRLLLGAGLLPAAALVVSPSAMGHAEEANAAAFALDVVHVQAASVWVGGLVFVLLALAAAAAGERWLVAGELVPRFSAFAVAQVPLLIAAGAVNGYFQVRGWWALFHTAYGQLLIAKVAIVLPLLALGAANRRIVPALRDGLSEARLRRRFLRATGLETVLFLSVLGVTAVLVGEPPARIAAAQAAARRTREARPYSAAQTTRATRFQLTVTPARIGSNRAILYLNDAHGQPLAGGPATLLVTPAGGGAAPLRLHAPTFLPGQFSFRAVPTPAAGTWLFTFLVRRGAGPAAIATFQVPVGK